MNPNDWKEYKFVSIYIIWNKYQCDETSQRPSLKILPDTILRHLKRSFPFGCIFTYHFFLWLCVVIPQSRLKIFTLRSLPDP